MDGTTVARYEFEGYSLLPSKRVLLRGGERVPLKPREFDTLLALVENYGRLLTKEELIGRIWPDRFVEEGSLSQNIFTLRRTFGERPRDHRYIVTVPGHGYRFVADVRAVGESRGTRRRTPQDGEVFQTYVKGRIFWDRRTEEGLRVGLASARDVVEAEPEFPLGYVGLADSYLLLGEYLHLPPTEAFPRALEAVQRALALDPESAEAHASLAEYTFFYERDWARAEELYRKAIRLNPDYAAARHWYTWFLIAMNRFDEALAQIREAQVIEPGSLVFNTILGLPHYYAGDYEQAVKQFRRTLEIDPRFHHARYYLGSALIHAGRRDEAISELKALVAADPLQQALALLGYCYAVSGRTAEARRVSSRVDKLERKRYVSPYVRAILHAGLGEVACALTELERAYESRDAWAVWLGVDPFFGSLRGEPRFARLLERLRLAG